MPEVLVDDDGTLLGTAGLVMAHVCRARPSPAGSCATTSTRAPAPCSSTTSAAFLAGLHAIDPAEVPGAVEADEPHAVLERRTSLVDDRSPTFEKAYEWLVANRPPRTATTIVHGDLRLGNIIVDADGLAAAIDWELVHVGDPLEDLAWLCVKAWRFGAPLEVGGLGTIDQLVAAYEAAGGRTVDRDALHWWLVAEDAAVGHRLHGPGRGPPLAARCARVELAAIGRRVAEQEWDLIELLAPDEWTAARGAPPPDALPDDAGRQRAADRARAARRRARLPHRRRHAARRPAASRSTPGSPPTCSPSSSASSRRTAAARRRRLGIARAGGARQARRRQPEAPAALRC